MGRVGHSRAKVNTKYCAIEKADHTEVRHTSGKVLYLLIVEDIFDKVETI